MCIAHGVKKIIIIKIHLPGKYNIADPLSRLLKVDMAQQSEFSKMTEEHVRFVALNSTTKAMTTHDVERASNDDADYSSYASVLTRAHGTIV